MPDTASSAAAVQGRSDEALLADCRRGDVDAFLALARRHHPPLRALAGCWPGGAHDAERDVASAWRAILAEPPPAGHPLRAHVARAVVAACVTRTGAPPEPHAPQPLGAERFFAADHDLWPGEWADPPRPWGSSAVRRLARDDIPRALARAVRELGIAPSAVLTLCDLYRWPTGECAFALDRTDAEVRAILHGGREGVRAALEAEIDAL